MLESCTSLDLANAFARVSSLSNLRLCHCVSECNTRTIRRLRRLRKREAKPVAKELVLNLCHLRNLWIGSYEVAGAAACS
jgi:hypothetical protein